MFKTNIFRKFIQIFNKKQKMLPEGKQLDEKIVSRNEKKEKFLESIRVKQEFKVKKKNGNIEAIFCEGDRTGICKYGE